MDLENYRMSIQPKWAKNQWIQTSPTRSPPCVVICLERPSTLQGTRKNGTHQTGEAGTSWKIIMFKKCQPWVGICFFSREDIFGICLKSATFWPPVKTVKTAWGHEPLSFPWARWTYLWTHGGIAPDELIRWMDSALTGVFWRLLMSPWVRLGGDLVGLVVFLLHIK